MSLGVDLADSKISRCSSSYGTCIPSRFKRYCRGAEVYEEWDVVHPLGKHLGPVLYQLPPGWKLDRGRITGLPRLPLWVARMIFPPPPAEEAAISRSR